MGDKHKRANPRGSGVEPIPEPDSPTAAREGSTAKVEDIVKGIMDNIEESLTGERPDDVNRGIKSRT
ncbi:hypothetical protein J2Z22_002974 [Paenibacillus forsythiae]|uniref:Uncharacterized protein n=1 Tax=Paenibacillus forsythiae TaxID=365616 RepID=A0ABU3HAB9_9BACL|nr:hypothetical protein [Paenibacillus forsythiae]MDT3427411.1 hypothetical protein [Paenibacillus forsythiae]